MALEVVDKITVEIVQGKAQFLLEEVRDPVIHSVYVDETNPGFAIVSYSGQEQECAVHSVQLQFVSDEPHADTEWCKERTPLGYAQVTVRKYC